MLQVSALFHCDIIIMNAKLNILSDVVNSCVLYSPFISGPVFSSLDFCNLSFDLVSPFPEKLHECNKSCNFFSTRKRKIVAALPQSLLEVGRS